jgi:ribonuclease HII
MSDDVGDKKVASVLPCLVRLQRQGKKMYQDCDIYIGREWTKNDWNLSRSKWYNESIENSLVLYEKYIRETPELYHSLDELSGKILGCWCGPAEKTKCHGNVLITLWKEKFPEFIEHPYLWKSKYYPEGYVEVIEKKKKESKKRKSNVVLTDATCPKKPRVSLKKLRNQKTKPDGIKLAGTLHPWPVLNHEWNSHTIWIDEAGMGCWAGPLHVAGVYLLPGFDIEGLHDSKLLREDERKDIYEKLVRNKHIIYHIEKMSNQDIDAMKLGGAWKEAIRRIVSKLQQQVESTHSEVKITRVILDGNKTVSGTAVEITPVTSADRLYAGVSAASILAKVSRDEFMSSIAHKYPEYSDIFKNGHGYRHSKHHDDLIKEGIYTDLHRKSFNPLKTKLLKPHIHVVKTSNSPIKVFTLQPGEALV